MSVSAVPQRQHLVWHGASFAGAALSDALQWVSWEEYDECGIDMLIPRLLGMPYYNVARMQRGVATGDWSSSGDTPMPGSPAALAAGSRAYTSRRVGDVATMDSPSRRRCTSNDSARCCCYVMLCVLLHMLLHLLLHYVLLLCMTALCMVVACGWVCVWKTR